MASAPPLSPRTKGAAKPAAVNVDHEARKVGTLRAEGHHDIPFSPPGMNFRLRSTFIGKEEAAMKQVENRQVRIPSPRDHCVQSTCEKFGISGREQQKMLQLLGKRAAAHELSNNFKNRPAKFR